MRPFLRTGHPLPPRTGSRLRSRAGFTFVEILLVMIMLGIVAAIGMKGVKASTRSTRVKRAARMISSDLQYAFSLAGARRRPVVIAFDSANVRYRFTNRTGDTTYFTRELGMKSMMQFRAGEVRFSSNSMTVFPNGLAADTLGVRLIQQGDTGRVWLARGGTTRVR